MNNPITENDRALARGHPVPFEYRPLPLRASHPGGSLPMSALTFPDALRRQTGKPPEIKYRLRRALIPRLLCFGVGLVLLPFSGIGSFLFFLAVLDTVLNPVWYQEIDYTAMGLPEPPRPPFARSVIRLAVTALLLLAPFLAVTGLVVGLGWLWP